MEKLVNKAKTFEEAYETLLKDNNLIEKDVLYKKETIKGKLFKGEEIEVTIYKKEDIISDIKDFLRKIGEGLNLEINFEVKNKEERTTIKMFSENNPILIGKNGQTIKALETLVRQKISNDLGINFKISLDVENYKDKKEARLVSLAKRTAKEVLSSKIAVHMDNMTSYERRIVHNTLTEFKGIKTHSEGEEPNRHIVIEVE